MDNCEICGYKLDDYEEGAKVCGACLDTYPEESVQLGDPLAISEQTDGGS